MMKIFKLTRYGGKLVGLLILAFIVLSNVNANAQKPLSPRLSLTGENVGYDANAYPDGRFWAAPSTSQDREVLVPVFIQNNFYTMDATQYIVPPIYSFKFSLFYDSAAVKATGIQLTHPTYMEDFLYLNGTVDEDPPFAYGWTVDWYDRPDSTYWYYLNPQKWEDNRLSQTFEGKRGRRITITGHSIMPMRHNEENFQDQWFVLLYIKFKIIGKEIVGDPSGYASLNTPMYISNSEIKFNNLDVTKQLAYEGFSHIYKTNYQGEYPSLDPYPGLAGLNNEDLTENITEPYRPGSIYFRISNGEPYFSFPSSQEAGYTITKVTDSYFMLDQVITVDSNSALSPAVGTKTIVVQNGLELSRLNYITMETNEPWLLISKDGGKTQKRTLPHKFLDNGLLGADAKRDPAGQPTYDIGPLNLTIVCDPKKLKLNDPTDLEKTGIHVGYITFKSPYARWDNVRLQVKFIYIRPPYEPRGPSNLQNIASGIYLNMVNSNPGDAARTLVFGTGNRASDKVDSLFGEYHPSQGLSTSQFDARFFPVDPTLVALYPNGFGDFSPNIDNPYSDSRDIRDYTANKSHLFLVKFNAHNGYPVVLTWNVSQIPNGARAFIRDVLNGAYFQPVDMLTGGTVVGDNLRSFTFVDARINSFYIEYTLPKEIKYVDNNNNPIIKNGWNLLSLPVRPLSPQWDVFYPRAINIPYLFTQNQWQDSPTLSVGYGYFIKFGSNVDYTFSGTQINEILPPIDKIRLNEGWNTIGALSCPTNITNIQFTRYEDFDIPSLEFALQYGIWGYTTNRGYEETSQLLPGLGYWIKVNSSGFYKLQGCGLAKNPEYSDSYSTIKGDILSSAIKLSINDNVDHSSDLYISNDASINIDNFELPPAPPTELFDVRFVNDKYLSNESSNIIKLQGVEYPVRVTIANADADYTLRDAISGSVLGTISRGTNGSVEITKTMKNAITVEKSNVLNDYELAVYPNPISIVSNVNVYIPEASNISLKLYNTLGNEVMTLFEGNVDMGLKSFTIKSKDLSTGAYILKLTSGNISRIVKVNVIN